MSKQVELPPELIERLLLEDADLATAVQRIRRAVDEEALDEAVADTVNAVAPAIYKHFSDRLLSDEVVEAAGGEAMRKHHFRPYDEITRTLLEAAALKAASIPEGSK